MAASADGDVGVGVEADADAASGAGDAYSVGWIGCCGAAGVAGDPVDVVDKLVGVVGVEEPAGVDGDGVGHAADGVGWCGDVSFADEGFGPGGEHGADGVAHEVCWVAEGLSLVAVGGCAGVGGLGWGEEVDPESGELA